MKPTDPRSRARRIIDDALAWLRDYTGESGKTCKVFTTTMGQQWTWRARVCAAIGHAPMAVGLEKKIPGKRTSNSRRIQARLVWFRQVQAGLKPEDFALRNKAGTVIPFSVLSASQTQADAAAGLKLSFGSSQGGRGGVGGARLGAQGPILRTRLISLAVHYFPSLLRRDGALR